MTSSATIPHSDIVLSRDGAGDRTIVFVHGLLDDLQVWNSVIAELQAPGFEIVRFDHAGFGGRTDASGPFSYDRFASDLSAVVDMLDKPFVLVGHSLGATVVELVAAHSVNSFPDFTSARSRSNPAHQGSFQRVPISCQMLCQRVGVLSGDHLVIVAVGGRLLSLGVPKRR